MTQNNKQIKDEKSLIVIKDKWIGDTKDVTIIDDDGYKNAIIQVKQIKTAVKQTESFFKDMIDTAHKAHKTILSRKKDITAPLELAEKAIKKEMGEYQQAIEDDAQRKRDEIALANAKKDDPLLDECLDILDEVKMDIEIVQKAPDVKGVSARKVTTVTVDDLRVLIQGISEGLININPDKIFKVNQKELVKYVEITGIKHLPGCTVGTERRQTIRT